MGIGFPRQFDRPRNIERRIGDSDMRRRDGGPNEAMRVQTIEGVGHDAIIQRSPQNSQTFA